MSEGGGPRDPDDSDPDDSGAGDDDAGEGADGTDADEIRVVRRRRDPAGDAPSDTPADSSPAPPADSGRWWLLGTVAALVALVGGLLLWSPWSSGARSEEAASGRPAPTTTATTSTTTTVPLPVAPLTGLPVAEADAALFSRPALAGKVDGAPEAMPQTGLAEADVVMEVRVEGISRYLAVWHSAVPPRIGPMRSARTSDPDLLAALGMPLFAYSGGNSGVESAVRSSEWIRNVSHDRREAAYSRDRSRRAPHNLYAETAVLYEGAGDDPRPPAPLFGYLPAGAEPAGEPVGGVSVPVGSGAVFRWDGDAGGWLRWAHNRPHLEADAGQLAPTNVVVLETAYRRSGADRISPEAVSTGEGRAWVLSGGRMQSGRWVRPSRAAPWLLVSDAGEPMLLQPGRTWVALADAPPAVLPEEFLASLPT